MRVEIPIELVKETVRMLTDQINMEMEAEDPCPGVGVSVDKQHPWYVELRNLFQEQLDKRDIDYDLGFTLAQHMYQRCMNPCDLVCPANVSDAFQDGFNDFVIAIVEEIR